jgi:hypothetical protein
LAATNGNGKLHSLTILDYSDRELLLIVMEEAEADADGFAHTHDIAARLGLDVKHPNNSTGVRLGYLKRIGAVEKADPHDFQESWEGSKWTVTPIGRMMATGQLKSAARKQLESMGPEGMMLLTRFAAQRVREAPNETVARLVQREWRHGVGR